MHMSKITSHTKKYTRKNESNIKNYAKSSNDSLQNLFLSIEKYKYLLIKANTNAILLNSTNATVINCINHVISEHGEESLKHQRTSHTRNHIVKETGDNQKDVEINDNNNNLWTKIVKELQEILTNHHKEINNELFNQILTMISQIHERQTLKITNPIVLNEISIKLINQLDNVDLKQKSHFLRCIASFILGNLHNIPKELFTNFSGTFFKESEKFLSKSVKNDFESLECLKYCISGLTNLCYNCPNQSIVKQEEDFLSKRFQICGKFLQIFITCLEMCPTFVELNPISRFRMQHQCLHGLIYISQRPHGLSVDNIERFLDLLRIYCGFGLFRVSSGTCNNNSVTTENEDVPIANGLLSTDDICCLSDTINSSHLYHNRPMRKWEIKTRKLSLELLMKILDKSWKKVSTTIWQRFMPLGSYENCCNGRFDLVNLLGKEHDPTLRLLVIQSIEMCIIGCRDFLVTAQHQPVSFVTFLSKSHNLACAIVDVHSVLLELLFIDKSCHIRLAVLKCLSALIKTAPYHRLKPGLIGSIVRSLRQLYIESDRDHNLIRCSILDCFTGLVSLESVSQEMHQLLLEPGKFTDNCPLTLNTAATVMLFSNSDTTRSLQPSWLVQLCVRLAHPVLVDRLWTCALSPESWGVDMDPIVTKVVGEGNQLTDSGLRCQALVTVSAMLAQHSSLIRPSLDTLKRTLLACLDESLQNRCQQTMPVLRSHVLRVFSGFLSTLENKKVKRYLGIMQDCQEEIQPGEIQSTFFSSTTNDELICEWWSSFLQPIVECLKDENDNVRRSAAQCLCFMCEPVLEYMMEADEVRSYWSILLEMFKDPCTAVSCQAVWALGYWIAMRPLNTDADFMGNLIESCVNLCEMAISDCSVYLVCANAAWTLSNVVEVLVAHKEMLLPCCKSADGVRTCAVLVDHYMHDIDSIRRLMTLFCDLCGLKKAGQVAASARIHENAIRGLGYLCRFINENIINNLKEKDFLLLASETFCKAIQLPDKAGRVKVKWNACLSVSHIYHNPALIVSDEVFHLHRLTDTLVNTVANDRYFKVRNNSLVSIITLIDRGGRLALGEHMFDIFIAPLATACLSVFQKSAIPFSEVHRHCLCLYLLHFTLIRLVNLLTQSDLDRLATDSTLLTLLSTVFNENLPLIWKHLSNLNRSFNKQALLTQTLMLKPVVSATYQEVDLLLSDLRMNLDRHWTHKSSNKPAMDLLNGLHISVTQSRVVVDNDMRMEDNAEHTCDSMSDDEGLMTKRPGTSLLFSQIYD